MSMSTFIFNSNYVGDSRGKYIAKPRMQLYQWVEKEQFNSRKNWSTKEMVANYDAKGYVKLCSLALRPFPKCQLAFFIICIDREWLPWYQDFDIE